MGRGYRPLTREERAQIAVLKRDGKSNRHVARLLGRDPSTIGRELRRNRGRKGYHPDAAQRKADEKARTPRHRKMTPEVEAFIEERLRQKLSPEQISHTMADALGIRVSHERIYPFVARDKQCGGDLYRHLRINHKRRYRRRHRRKGAWRTKIPNRVDIDQRPVHVERREEVGHWEADLVRVAGGYLVTLVERAKRFLLAGTVVRKRADLVYEEMARLLTPYSPVVHSITYDNGPEFSGHERLNERLGCRSYFAKPYHSWERGRNENMNGLLRQYFPKGERGARLDSDKVAFAQDQLNRRPRKTLNWQSPMTCFSIFSKWLKSHGIGGGRGWLV